MVSYEIAKKWFMMTILIANIFRYYFYFLCALLKSMHPVAPGKTSRRLALHALLLSPLSPIFSDNVNVFNDVFTKYIVAAVAFCSCPLSRLKRKPTFHSNVAVGSILNYATLVCKQSGSNTDDIVQWRSIAHQSQKTLASQRYEERLGGLGNG